MNELIILLVQTAPKPLNMIAFEAGQSWAGGRLGSVPYLKSRLSRVKVSEPFEQGAGPTRFYCIS